MSGARLDGLIFMCAAASKSARLMRIARIEPSEIGLKDRQKALQFIVDHFPLPAELQYLRTYSGAKFKSMTPEELDALGPVLDRLVRAESLAEAVSAVLPLEAIKAEILRRRIESPYASLGSAKDRDGYVL